jgi:hypothetical protein
LALALSTNAVVLAFTLPRAFPLRYFMTRTRSI